MKRETSNVLVAFLLGAVAGGVTALLLAPASGAETRKRLKETLRSAKERPWRRSSRPRSLPRSRRRPSRKPTPKARRPTRRR